MKAGLLFDVAPTSPKKHDHGEETADQSPEPERKKQGFRHLGHVGRQVRAGPSGEEIVGSGEDRESQLHSDEDDERLQNLSVELCRKR